MVKTWTREEWRAIEAKEEAEAVVKIKNAVVHRIYGEEVGAIFKRRFEDADREYKDSLRDWEESGRKGDKPEIVGIKQTTAVYSILSELYYNKEDAQDDPTQGAMISYFNKIQGVDNGFDSEQIILSAGVRPRYLPKVSGIVHAHINAFRKHGVRAGAVRGKAIPRDVYVATAKKMCEPFTGSQQSSEEADCVEMLSRRSLNRSWYCTGSDKDTISGFIKRRHTTQRKAQTVLMIQDLCACDDELFVHAGEKFRDAEANLDALLEDTVGALDDAEKARKFQEKGGDEELE